MVNFKKQILLVSDNNNFFQEAMSNLKRADAMGLFEMNGVTLEDSFQHQQEPPPDLVIVDLDHETQSPTSIVQNMSHRFTQSKIVGAGRLLNVDTILQLIKFGAQDFLKVPFDAEEIRTLLQAATRRSGSQDKSGHTGKIITVLSPKGGTGVTLLTANLAVALQQIEPRRIAVCDFMPQCGDIATYLNLKTQYTLRDLIDNIEQIDESFLEGVTLSHESGIHVFASPREDQEPLNATCMAELQSILSYLRQSYDTILIDGCYVDETLLQISLMYSDMVLLLANLDVPSLKGLVYALNKIRKHHFDPENIRIIINRYNAKNHLEIKEFEKKTGHPISLQLPNDYQVCIESINTGQPINKINKNAALTKKIAELASDLQPLLNNSDAGAGSSARPEAKKSVSAVRKGLFGWLL